MANTNIEELEQKVFQIIRKNKEFQKKCNELTKENEVLQQEKQQIETALLKENNTNKELEDDKIALKNSIDNILNNINSLEETN